MIECSAVLLRIQKHHFEAVQASPTILHNETHVFFLSGLFCNTTVFLEFRPLFWSSYSSLENKKNHEKIRGNLCDWESNGDEIYLGLINETIKHAGYQGDECTRF
jgi:hypothetical protein